MEEKLQELKQTIIKGDRVNANVLTEELVAAGVDPQEILESGLIAGMETVGELFKQGKYYVPEMLIAARAMKEALQIIRPLLIDSGVEPVGTVVIGTVKGDLHDIGKNLTGMFLEGAGFEVIDLGVDVSAEQFIAATREHEADIIAMSALLTTTMTYTSNVIEALENEKMRSQVKVVVGGAPMTQEWADHIGADGFALDAASGADRCKELLTLAA